MTVDADRGPVARGASEPAAAVDALSVRFPTRSAPALDHVSLRLAAGEQVLVLGPSGSGKSTLLGALAGHVPQSVAAEVAGTVHVAGQDAATTPVARLSAAVGYVFQDPQSQVCLPRVDDEVAFALENRAVPPEMIAEQAHAALEQVGAAHLAERATDELSGGEQQRVALASVLVGDPDLLLLDEPTSLLDPVGAAGVAEVVTQVQRHHGEPPAVVLVEHRLDELPRLPERTAVLDRDGRLVADGPTNEVLARHGLWIAAHGGWLPLGVELSLASGCPTSTVTAEALADPDVAAFLRRLGHTHPDASRIRDLPDPAAPTAVAAETARPEAPVVLAARGASFVLDGHRPLDRVDMCLRSGEITAVIGANGSGKTTLLLGLAGLLPIAEGEVDGGPAGMAFQHPENQFLARSVAREVAYGLDRAAIPALERDRRVDAALERFALSHLADEDPFRLSGGEQRRLSIAAMAVLDHPVLLLDEPTFGQDRHSALAVADHLVDIAAAGAAVAFATHDLRLVGLIADRVVVLHQGSMARSGPTEQILADDALLTATGLARPRLLDWWAEQHHGPGPTPSLPALLAGLHSALDIAPHREATGS